MAKNQDQGADLDLDSTKETDSRPMPEPSQERGQEHETDQRTSVRNYSGEKSRFTRSKSSTHETRYEMTDHRIPNSSKNKSKPLLARNNSENSQLLRHHLGQSITMPLISSEANIPPTYVTNSIPNEVVNSIAAMSLHNQSSKVKSKPGCQKKAGAVGADTNDTTCNNGTTNYRIMINQCQNVQIGNNNTMIVSPQAGSTLADETSSESESSSESDSDE